MLEQKLFESMHSNTFEALSRNLNQKDLEQTREHIFFILGTSRSGSTLLQSMLNMHSKLTIPPETHFFHSYRVLETNYNNRDISGLIDFWQDNKTRMKDLQLPKKLLHNLSSKLGIKTPAQLFDLYLTLYRLLRNKKVVGEKTPKHIRHVKEILSVYPKAKIISMFRDPRATANSEINAMFGSPSVVVSTRRWSEYVKIHFQLKKELPESTYMMIQYRDLIANPEKTLREVTAHLGWEFEEQMLHYYRRDKTETGYSKLESDWKNETFEPLKNNKNEKWKQQLSFIQIALVEKIAEPWLKKMGYSKKGWRLPYVILYVLGLWDLRKSLWAQLKNERDEGYLEPDKDSF